MGKQVDWNDVPDPKQAGDLPDGIYLLGIESLTKGASTGGKLMVEGIIRVVEPLAFTGSPLYENFVLGSDTDPQADDPHTLRAAVAMGILKKMFTACGMPLERDLDVMLAQAAGQRFLASVYTAVESAVLKSGAPNPYAGQKKNRMGRMWRVGERPVGLSQSAPPTPAANAVNNGVVVQTVKSPFTGEQVPVAAFAAHVAAHSGGTK